MQHTSFQMTRRGMLGTLGAALALPHAAFAADLSVLSGRAFGTSWRLVTPRSANLTHLRDQIDALFSSIDRTFSPWRADSLITRFNRLPAAAPVESRELAQVTAAALTISRQSEGAFDPTVGPLVARWGFGPIQDGGAPDWRGIAASFGSVRKARDDLTLDLCGIAKGWALDRAASVVEATGLETFLFELGGEFISRGQHPDARDWRLSVEIPDSFSVSPPALRLPDGSAVATSGIWTQSYRTADRLYSHIIDTSAAQPVSGVLCSVTVVAPDAITADGWATALCAAGPEQGPDLATSLDIAALFLIADQDGLRQVQTGPVRAFLMKRGDL